MRNWASPLYRRFPWWIHWAHRLTGSNNEPEMALLSQLCDPARAGLDIGSKTGMYTFRMARRCREVIAFEPVSELAAVTASANGAVGRGNVKVENYALSDVNGSAEISIPMSSFGRAMYGRSSIAPDNAFRDLPEVEFDRRTIDTRRLDSLELPRVGFIKIDVEGHELAVLKGALALIGRDRPNLLVELNERHNPDVALVYTLLKECRYRPYSYDSQSLVAIDGPGQQISENVIFLPEETSPENLNYAA